MIYSSQYFEKVSQESRSSAAAVVPVVCTLLNPRSVVDVGCGTGAWLAAFMNVGIRDVRGVDGFCPADELEIPAEKFLQADLTQPLPVHRSFDLALCLEVAEHLSADHSEQLVKTLTELAPMVLFSAAVPYQGGCHHVNEQWPQYWIERFARQDFVPLDLFRRRLWSSEPVSWWYAQNLLLFVRAALVNKVPSTRYLADRVSDIPALVHPRCFLQLAWRNRVLETALELTMSTPDRATIALLDEDRFGDFPRSGRRIVPFPERNGVYAGVPANSLAAIEELERQKVGGIAYLAVGWPAFWWLEYFEEFALHLTRYYRELHRSDNLILYSLSS
jgi:SAM-dependent methyltransferase